jgi:hypothetical protein
MALFPNLKPVLPGCDSPAFFLLVGLKVADKCGSLNHVNYYCKSKSIEFLIVFLPLLLWMKANSIKQENTIEQEESQFKSKCVVQKAHFYQYLSQDLALARAGKNQGKKGGLTKLLPPKVI